MGLDRFAHSFDEEHYTGEFDSKELAIKDARECLGDNGDNRKSIFVGIILYHFPSEFVDSDRVVEEMEERAYDEMGCDDEVIDVVELKGFGKALDALVDKFCSINYWTVGDIKEIKI